jgi:glycosyltransferase involved in cell wall biosynthesis
VTDCVVAISPGQRRDLVERFKVASAEQTAVIPLGLDLAPFLEHPAREVARRSLGIQRSALVIGYVGRFVPIKDLGTLLRAFATVARQSPDAVLLMAGDGPDRRELEEIAERSSIRDRVEFIGWTDDLPSIYAAMDICCLSSLNEGTPVALIEAMASATAVVATRVGAVEDLVEDGLTGVLVPPSDADALARAILGLHAAPERLQRIADAGRAAVFERYAIERLVRDIHHLYVTELQKKRGAGLVHQVRSAKESGGAAP